MIEFVYDVQYHRFVFLTFIRNILNIPQVRYTRCFKNVTHVSCTLSTPKLKTFRNKIQLFYLPYICNDLFG
jgi:hypothetical protein